MLCAGETLIPTTVAPQFTAQSPLLGVEVTPEAVSATEITAGPCARQVTRPCVSTVATDRALEDHRTAESVKVPVCPVKVALAFNVVVPATGRMTLFGVIFRVVGAPPTTASTAPLLLFADPIPVEGSTASTAVDPRASPFTFPVGSMEATPGFETLHLTLPVRSWVAPEPKCPVAREVRASPIPIARFDGEMEMVTSGSPAARAIGAGKGTDIVAVKTRRAMMVARFGRVRTFDIDGLLRDVASRPP